MGEFVKIEIRPLLTKIDAKFSFSAIKIKISTGNDRYSGKNGQAPNVRYNGRFRYCGRCL